MIKLFITICLLALISTEMLTCGKYTCDSEHGECIGKSNSLCFCNDRYDTLPNETSNVMCSYEKKKQWIAFVLEIVGFGIGHFYTGKLGIGVPKLIMYMLACIAIVVLRILSKKTEENNPTTLFMAFIACTVCCSIFIWHIIDAILYGLNKYKDGYGIDLLAW
jgi:hypothetical protein